MATEQNVLYQILKFLTSFQMSEVLWALLTRGGTMGQGTFPSLQR